MMDVKVWKVDELVGMIRLLGEKLECDPPGESLLKGIVSEPISLNIDGEWRSVDPSSEPELFIQNLYRYYRSVYLRVGEAMNPSLQG